MTSKLTRERLAEIAQFGFSSAITVANDFEIKELARLVLAAIDSESWCLPLDYLQGHKDGLEWASQLAEANHPETGDWLYDDPIELAKAIRKGPDMPPAQPAPVVPEKCPAEIRDLISSHTDALFNDDDAQEIWNACRSAMLQASPVCTCPSGDGSLRWPCPVHPGNSPAIPDSARDALEKALAAMEFMGDTLNNLDAVCTEDVELVSPAFDAVRSVLAAALQEGK